MKNALAILYPRKLRTHYQQLLNYANNKTPANKFIAISLVIGLVITIFLSFFIRIFLDFSLFLIIPAVFIITQGAVYAWLNLTADSRAKFVETLLPDVLQLMASNLRAGLTVDRALLLSARPEFGQFKEDINRVGKEIATGKELDQALMSLSSRIKSEHLKKTFQLIVTAMSSGGELADLLEQTASNLRQQRLVEQRIRASVLVYVIFIFSAIAFGAPMLFGLSSFLVQVITDIFGRVQLPPASALGATPISFSDVAVSVNFINTYTIVSLVATSIMGSLILGLIAKGKEKEGFKTMPILIIMTISLFFVIKYAIGLMLGGLFEF